MSSNTCRFFFCGLSFQENSKLWSILSYIYRYRCMFYSPMFSLTHVSQKYFLHFTKYRFFQEPVILVILHIHMYLIYHKFGDSPVPPMPNLALIRKLYMGLYKNSEQGQSWPWSFNHSWKMVKIGFIVTWKVANFIAIVQSCHIYE